MNRSISFVRRVVILAVIVVFASSISVAKEKSPEAKNGSTPLKQQQASVRQPAFLGLGVESLPAAVASHVSGMIEDGRGVLVAAVVEGSPAEKAGVQMFDIVLGYDDQRLFSPEQLVRLVHSDKVGRQVTLDVLRAGKRMQLQVKLGQQPVGPVTYEALRPPVLENPSREQAAETPETRWSTFDSMSLTQLKGNRFRAEIRFRDDEGQIETHAFEGTRDELRKDILAEKHLPANERKHLLRALDLGSHPFDFELPGIRITPRGDVIWDLRTPDQQ